MSKRILDERRLEQLKEAPYQSVHFTEELKDRIRLSAGRKRRGQLGSIKIFAALALGAAAVFIILLVILPLWKTSTASVQPEVRTSYMSNGKKLFEVAPGGDLTAGEPAGMIISFKEPFDRYRGKTLAIHAIHLASGVEETLVAGHQITQPSSGYSTLERYALPSAGLPLSGYWRIIVEWDGEWYGDAVLEAREPAWEESPMFSSGSYNLRGVKGRLGILDAGFIAGDTNKYMWSLWGSEEELSGTFKAIAVKHGSDRLLELYSLRLTGGESQYADSYFPSSLSLPEPGLWRIMAYVDDRLLGSIVVDAKEKDEELAP